MDEKTLKRIINFGALKYSAIKICKILGYNKAQTEQFLIEFENEDSAVRRNYDQGVAIGEYNIDAELAKQAEKGEIFSIIELRKGQYHRKIEDLKKDLFGI